MKITLALILFFALNGLFAQTSTKAKNKSRSDSTIIVKLFEKIDAEDNLGKVIALNKEAKIKIENLPDVMKKRLVYKQFSLLYLVNEAYCFTMKSDYKNASKTYFKSLNRALEIKDSSSVSTIYNSLATIFSDQKEYEKAILYFKKSAKIRLLQNDYRGLGSVYNNLGYLYNEMDSLELQKASYLKSLEYRSIVGDSSEIILTIGNLGIVYKKEKDFVKSLEAYNLSLNYELRQKDSVSASLSYLNLGMIYLELKDFKKSELNFLKGYRLAEITSNNYALFNISQRLVNLYENLNDHKNALKYLKISTKLEKIHNNDEQKNSAIKSEFDYQNNLKLAEIKSLSQEKKITELNSSKKSQLIYSIILIFISLSIIAYFLFSRFKVKKQNELLKTQLQEAEKVVEAEKMAAESELKALKSQMNPHFIFNALNSIQEQFMYGDKLKANEQMGNFTYLTRQILTVSGKKKITLETEIEILTKYLELEKMRFSKDFEYKIETQKDLDIDYFEVPPMIIQPFIENSMKHGLLHKEGKKTIHLFFEISNNEDAVICTVIDNGVGRDKSAKINESNIHKHESFSTSSVEKRLKLISRTENSKNNIVYTDLFDSSGNSIGTKVVIIIPF